MIVYSLACRKGHAFEGWFKDSAAYDEQAAGGKLVCPVCRSRKIDKAPMAPSLKGAGVEKNKPSAAELQKMRQFMTGLRKYVEENAEYVGTRFPEEARKIHYGETDERHIYGEATIEEAKELVEEGVDVAPLPPDLNDAN
ncbi:MAG: DUF1178 family protein [Alphaproteobacteria bacterium]|nr:DUF1178 family protein [Alphaproteobacteria bacterium]MBN9567145.1 DUF1178 family protein [Alphaproteobacteria bacterium]MBN9577031.1 DUF1178 family protein [Alphaproteobacteria bacterium]OJU56211.1 MAG: hypothetical protein BGO00_10600 [Alphaproteobacteria bacterium 62-8]